MDVMIDIETFGNKPSSVIVAIGAVMFDPQHPPQDSVDMKERFYACVDARSQKGRTMDADTIYWWLQQDRLAIAALLNDQKPIGDCLVAFTSFLTANKPKKAWCYGATFDHVILDDVFTQLGLINPVHYRDRLDMRTFIELMPKVPRPNPPNAVAHNAIHDCMIQAKWMQHCYAAMRGLNTKESNAVTPPQSNP